MTRNFVRDFRLIKAGGKVLTPARFNREHERCFTFLQDAVAASKDKHIVVATHHAPSFQLNTPNFRVSPITGAFTVELYHFIKDSRIECWTYGRSLVDIDRYSGNFITICALKLSPLVMLLPGELRRLKWEQVDFERQELRLPIEHMKRRQTEKITRQGELAHTVPLARQALAILEELHRVSGDCPFLFPHYRKRQDRCMSNATILNAHDFRALASTNLNELGYPPDCIERQLAHVDRNRIRAAYNHAEYMEQRRAMMQAWADWLDARREEARPREACGASAGGVR